jgi:hypothetical protein
MTWTLPKNITDSWIGGDAPTDSTLVEVWIGRAERLLRTKVPTLQQRISSGEPDLLEKTRDVVSNMVQRVFRNPEGIRQKNTTTGPFTESTTYGGDQPGYLWVTDEELGSLTQGVPGRRRAFTINTMPTVE